jgi:hypothetical protein
VPKDLQTLWVLAGQKAVIQDFEADAFFAQLRFGSFMSIETDLDVKRKVGAYLDEEQAEILIQDVEVIIEDEQTLAAVLEPDAPPLRALLCFVAQRLFLSFPGHHHPRAF